MMRRDYDPGPERGASILGVHGDCPVSPVRNRGLPAVSELNDCFVLFWGNLSSFNQWFLAAWEYPARQWGRGRCGGLG